jgi:hypothetical protein
MSAAVASTCGIGVIYVSVCLGVDSEFEDTDLIHGADDYRPSYDWSDAGRGR